MLLNAPRDRAKRGMAVRPRLLTEFVLLAIGYLAYSGTRIAVRGERGVAIHNGRLVYAAERGWAPEKWADQWLSRHTLLAGFSSYYYATAHFAVTLLVIVWLYWRHPKHYRPLRTILVCSTLAALLGFWLFPVAPPRDVLSGITDTVASRHTFEALAPRGGSTVANLYAAMPSLHVGWAVWCALAVWWVYRRRRPILACLAFLYPVVTTLDVIGTGNHYLLDAIAGSAAIGVGCLVWWIASRGIASAPALARLRRSGSWMGRLRPDPTRTDGKRVDESRSV